MLIVAFIHIHCSTQYMSMYIHIGDSPLITHIAAGVPYRTFEHIIYYIYEKVVAYLRGLMEFRKEKKIRKHI